MQALKALVIFMAVLIVAGMVLLVYGLITRTGGGEEQAAAPAPAATATPGGAIGAAPPGPTPLAPFGSLDLAVPDGCSLAASELAGDRLVVRFTGQPARGCQLLVIVDLASGREIGRVKAVPATAQSAP